MPYTAEISRANPACILFLIDQSASMEDNWAAEPGKPKAHGLATILNRILQNLVLRCAKAEGVRDYFEVGVIGYGANLGPAFAGELAGRELVPVSQLADHPARVEERVKREDDGAGGILERTIKFPVWFDPTAQNGTPMRQAFTMAHQILSRWVEAHPACFPPIVINITDGESTDGDPAPMAAAIRALATQDGSALLFNVHLSGSDKATAVFFPDEGAQMPDRFAEMLFGMSSPLPQSMLALAQHEGFKAGESSRGFIFNADPVALIQFLDIGTRPGNLR